MTKRQNYENGQAIVLIAFAFIGFVAMAGLAIDGGLMYSDRRHAQNAADAGSLAGGGAAALTLENNHIFYNDFDCNDLSSVISAAITAGDNLTLSNGYPSEDSDVVISDCNDTGPDKYLDITATIQKTTQTTLIQLVWDGGDVHQVVTATTRVRPRQPLVLGNAIVALNDDNCSGQKYGVGFHGGPDVEVIGGGIFSNGCLRDDGGPNVDVTDGEIFYFDTPGIDPDNYDPDPTLLTNPNQRLPYESYQVDPPNCSDPDANNVTSSDIEGHSLSPGLYCVSGNIKVNNAGDSFSGDGVTIYMLDGEFNTNGGIVDISAPLASPDPSPAIPGILIMFAPGNNSDILLNGNGGSRFKGTVLAPDSDITMLGGGDTEGFRCQIIGNNVEVGGNATTFVQYDDADQYSKPTSMDLQK